MPHQPREAVDTALLKLFEETWLDVDATRERVTTGIDARIAEATAQAARADRDAAAKRAASTVSTASTRPAS